MVKPGFVRRPFAPPPIMIPPARVRAARLALLLLLAACLPAAPALARDKPGVRVEVGRPSALESRADHLLARMVDAVASRDDAAYAACFRADYRDDDGTSREAERRTLARAWATAPELRLAARRLAVKELRDGYELTAATELVTGAGARAETVAYLVDGNGLIYRARFLDGDVDERERRIEEKLARDERARAVRDRARDAAPHGWIPAGRNRNRENRR